MTHFEGPHEHHGRGRGRRGPFGPGQFPFPPFEGPEPGWGMGPRGRGRGRASRGDVRIAIIALLAEEPRNGYQIIQEIERRTDGIWRTSSGAVYPALAQLEDESLIARTEAGGKLYTLTEAGREYADGNTEQLSRVWEDAIGGPGPRFEEFIRHRELLGQLFMAYKQVTQVGTAAQREEARSILIAARQSLYRILAADEQADSDPADGGE